MQQRPDPQKLQSLLFGVDVDIYVLSADQALPRRYGPYPTNAAAVTASFVLTKLGLRVAKLGESKWDPTVPLPDWLSGVVEPSRNLVRKIRSRKEDSLLVGIDEKRLLAPHDLWEKDRFQLMGDPRMHHVEELAKAAKAEEPLGYSVNSIFLWAADGDASWAFNFELVKHDGRVVLGTHPLLEGGRVQ